MIKKKKTESDKKRFEKNIIYNVRPGSRPFRKQLLKKKITENKKKTFKVKIATMEPKRMRAHIIIYYNIAGPHSRRFCKGFII